MSPLTITLPKGLEKLIESSRVGFGQSHLSSECSGEYPAYHSCRRRRTRAKSVLISSRTSEHRFPWGIAHRSNRRVIKTMISIILLLFFGATKIVSSPAIVPKTSKSSLW